MLLGRAPNQLTSARRLVTAVAAPRFYLNCADPDAVNIQILQAPSEAARTQNLPLPLLEAGREKPRTSRPASELEQLEIWGLAVFYKMREFSGWDGSCGGFRNVGRGLGSSGFRSAAEVERPG